MGPPPGFINDFGFARLKGAKTNRRFGIEQTRREKLVLAVVHRRDLARFAFSILLTNAIGEKPWMSTAQSGLGGRRDPQPQTRLLLFLHASLV